MWAMCLEAHHQSIWIGVPLRLWQMEVNVRHYEKAGMDRDIQRDLGAPELIL